MVNPSHLNLSRQLGQALMSRDARCAVAESCTGGQLAAAITDIAGSSHWFDRGFVTYSNSSKIEMLGVPQAHLEAHGAVSEAVVCAMAEGALRHSKADITVAISGIAGPDGGTLEKPVGLVWFAWSMRQGKTDALAHHFSGDRLLIRAQAVTVALEGLLLRCY